MKNKENFMRPNSTIEINIRRDRFLRKTELFLNWTFVPISHCYWPVFLPISNVCTELINLNRTWKLITIHKTLTTSDDIDIIYVTRKEGKREFADIEDCINLAVHERGKKRECLFTPAIFSSAISVVSDLDPSFS